MGDIGKVLKEEIRNLVARQIKANVEPLKKELRSIKRELSAQKRSTTEMERIVVRLKGEAEERRADEMKATVEEVQSARIRPDTVKRLRKKLGLSREDFAALAGVSANAVYLWETGKSAPRSKARSALVELRKLGVREARKRLEGLAEQQTEG